MGRVQFIQLFSSQRDWSERSFLVVFVFGFAAIWMTAVAGALYQLRVPTPCFGSMRSGRDSSTRSVTSCFESSKGDTFPGCTLRRGHLLLSAVVIYLLVTESRQVRTRATRSRPATRRRARRRVYHRYSFAEVASSSLCTFP
jgi:hypothetical protein